MGRQIKHVTKATNKFYLEIETITATFGQKIIDRRRLLILSQRELAKMVGVSVNTLQSYERGCLPRGQHFLSLAKSLHCSLNWLVGMSEGDGYNNQQDNFVENQGGGLKNSHDQFGQQNYFFRPEFLQSNDNDLLKYRAVAFNNRWLTEISTKPQNLRLLVFKGPSMQPTLNDGDLLMIDSGQTEIFSGCLYLVAIDDSQQIIRLVLKPDNYLRVVSDNYQMCPPYDLPAEQVEICGRIVWFSRSI